MTQRDQCYGRIQLNLNSLGSARFSFNPSASEGLSLYGLEINPSIDVGRAFSSEVGSFVTGRRDVKGMRKGGMAAVLLNKDYRKGIMYRLSGCDDERENTWERML